MKRRFLMGILALGTVGGYAWGFSTMSCHRHHAHERRAAFERHIASVCVEAARAEGKGAAPTTGQPTPRPAQEERGAPDR